MTILTDILFWWFVLSAPFGLLFWACCIVGKRGDEA